MSKKMSALKKLATKLGCCQHTEDVEAMTTAEAIEFISDHISSVTSKEVKDIKLRLDVNGKLYRGGWTDANNNYHSINIEQDTEED